VIAVKKLGLLTVGAVLFAHPVAGADELPEGLEEWFLAYAEHWRQPSTSDRTAVAGYYAAPYYDVDESGPTLISDPAAHFRQLWDMWDEQARADGDRAWVGDRVTYVMIEPFSANAARIKSEWQGYDRLGDKRPECLVADYQVALFPEGWKFTGLRTNMLPSPCESLD
jgi:hypothetical protein